MNFKEITSIYSLFLVTFFLFLFHSNLFSQIAAGGDVVLKFGESKNEFNYSEVLLNMNVSNDLLTTWFQFEYSEPPEIGSNINGLRKFRVDYSNGPIELSVGDVYNIWGRGLILNQFDDQDVNLDNGYRGLSFGLIEEKYALNLISGISNISRISTDYSNNIDPELRNPNHHASHSLFGGDLEIFTGPLSFAFSSLQSRENHPLNDPLSSQPDSIDVIHRIHGLRGTFEASSLSAYVEYANKSTLLSEYTNNKYLDDFRPFDGFSLFANLNYYLTLPPFDGWSLTMEYKNYNTTKINPDERNNDIKNYDMNLIFTQPPTVLREHSSVLLARLIPQVNFSDEVGYQVSFVGPVGSLGYFTLNYQAASRTNIWIKDVPDSVNAMFGATWGSDSSLTLLPFKNEVVAFPYDELYIEMEGYLDKIRYQFGLGWTNKVSAYHVLYNSAQNGFWDEDEPFMDLDSNGVWNADEDFSDYYSIVNERIESSYTNAFTIPTILNYNIGNGWSIDFKYEFQKLKYGNKYLNTLSSDEIFTDSDGDGIWDPAEIFFDDNENGVWDGAEETWYDWWLKGWIPDDQLSNYDLNGNGEYDPGEQFTDLDNDGLWDDAEGLTDLDGDGVWDEGEELEDLNLDGIWTSKGSYVDSSRSNFYSYKNNTDEKISKEFQNNHLITIGIGKSPYWSISLTVESSSAYQYGPKQASITNPLENLLSNLIDMENKWVALEMMININSSTRLDIMYGTLRGGIICSNGICRFVEPFDDGFKLGLTTVF